METLRHNRRLALLVLITIGHLFWLKFALPDIIYALDSIERLLIIGLSCYIYQFSKADFIGWQRLGSRRNIFLTVLAAAAILFVTPIIEAAVYTYDPNGLWFWHSFPAIKIAPLNFTISPSA